MMSDLMLLGILRMPDDSIAGDCAGFMQFVSAARSAADRIEADAKIIADLRAALEAAAADKRDAERYRWLRERGGAIWHMYAANENPKKTDGKLATGNYYDAAIDAALSHRQEES